MASHFSFCVPPAAHQPDIRSLDLSISQRRMLIRLFWLLLYILSATFPIVFLPQTLNAGGPHYVAGISYFDAGTKGIPLTWTQGSISYYTDQGDLSPLLLRRRLRRGCFQSLDFHHHGGGRHHPGGTAC